MVERRDARRCASLIPLAAALLGTLALPGAAHAIAACTAAQVTSQDPQCPAGSTPCNISRVFEIGNGCTLDFGTRAVTVLGSGEFNVQSNAATIRSGTFSVAPGGRVEGRGNLTTPPRDRGGMLTIQTTGVVNVQRSGAARGIFDFSGNVRAGTLIINAGGAVTVQGDIMADGLMSPGGNGAVTLRSGGDIVTGTSAVLSAQGGLTGTGGFFDIRAAGRVDLGTTVNVNGGDGGVVDVLAGSEAIVRGVAGTGAGDAGSGGCASVFAGTRVQMLGAVVLNGTGSPTLSGGGCGGFIDIESRFGDTTISAPITAESGAPDGGGGGVSVIARGSVVQAAAAPISVQGIGPSSCGGEVSLEADLDVTASGTLNASGGFGGNLVDLIAGRNIAVNGMVDASGRDTGSFGGSVTVVAGERGQGNVAINSSVNAGGGGCGALVGCGLGGFTEVTGCNVTVASSASLMSRGGDGGDNLLVAREKLTVQGAVNATTTIGGTNGTNTFQHPSRVAPTIVANLVAPAPTIQALATCSVVGQTNCLVPCPACGNGMVEFPETCDQAGTPVNCDGCSNFCRTQNCNDANGCTADSCDATLGCRNLGVNDGQSCTDGNVCNGVEVCATGVCRAPSPGPNCNDLNPCTTDSCHPTLGCQNPATGAGTPCTDNNACTIGDSCNNGMCAPGNPQLCVDLNACTTDACTAQLGCVFTPIAGCSTTTTLPGQPTTTTTTTTPLPTTTSTSLPLPTTTTTTTSLPSPSTTTTSVAPVPTTSTSLAPGATTTTSVAVPTTTSTSLPGATTSSTTTPAPTTSTSLAPPSTTTTSRPRPSTTSTTLSGGCVPANCSDGNECTTDVCQSGTCIHRSEGFDAVACELNKLLAPNLCGADPIDPKLQKAFLIKGKNARDFVGRAENNTKTGQKLLGRAARNLTSLRTRIAKVAGKGKISPACQAILDDLVGDRQALLQGLLTP